MKKGPSNARTQVADTPKTKRTPTAKDRAVGKRATVASAKAPVTSRKRASAAKGSANRSAGNVSTWTRQGTARAVRPGTKTTGVGSGVRGVDVNKALKTMPVLNLYEDDLTEQTDLDTHLSNIELMIGAGFGVVSVLLLVIAIRV